MAVSERLDVVPRGHFHLVDRYEAIRRSREDPTCVRHPLLKHLCHILPTQGGIAQPVQEDNGGSRLSPRLQHQRVLPFPT